MNRFAPFEWIAAMRFMREGLAQTLLIIVGVALGVGVIVFMSALIAGLQSNIIRRTLNYVAPIVVVSPDQVARPQRGERDAAARWCSRARSSCARSTSGRRPGADSSPARRRGGDAGRLRAGLRPARRRQQLGQHDRHRARQLSAGDRPGRQDRRRTAALGTSDIVIGTELAKDLGAGVGDKLRLTTAPGGTETLTVAAIFDFGNKGVNERNVYVGLRTAQNLLDLAGGVSSINVKVQDPFAAETIAQTIQGQTGLQADSWIKTNAQFFTAMAAQSLSNTLIRFFVGLTAALGIASVLVVSVVQKSKEIGILRAMGTSRGQVLRLFLLQGASMGLVGRSSAARWAGPSCWSGAASRVAADGTPIFVIVVEPSLFVIAAVGATLVGTLAAVIPARRAARLDPAVAIRG